MPTGRLLAADGYEYNLRYSIEVSVMSNLFDESIIGLQQTALIEIGLQIAIERDPQHLLETFCQSSRDLIGARYAIVDILGEDTQELPFFFTCGMDIEKAVGLGEIAPH